MGYKSRHHTNRVRLNLGILSTLIRLNCNWLKTYGLIELKAREWYIEDSTIDYSKLHFVFICFGIGFTPFYFLSSSTLCIISTLMIKVSTVKG